MLIKLNITAFSKLQGERNETQMALDMGISRTQIWRAKTGSPIGEDFIAKFKIAFPNESFEKYFIVTNQEVV